MNNESIIYIDLDDTIVKNKAVSNALSDAYEKISSITGININIIKQEAMNLHLEFIKNNDIRAFDWDFLVNLIVYKFKRENSNINVENLVKEHINDVIILDNALHVLTELKKRFMLVLATNGLYKYQKWIIKTLKIENLFDEIITPDKVGCIKTCRKFYELPYNNYNKIMIGDHPIFDVYYPKKFGLKTILIDRGFKSSTKSYADILGVKIENIKPDVIIKKLDDLIYIIDKL